MSALNPQRLEQTISAIAALDLTPIKFKATRQEDGYGWTPEQADRMEIAYKQYLTLHAKYPELTLAPDQDVDRFWHLHILDTRKYAADCEAVFGYFLHHYPYLGLRGEDDAKLLQSSFEKTQELYAREFGAAAQGQSTWCGAEVAQGEAAWCGADGPAKQQAAWCGADGPAKQAAWCGADGPAKKAAWCGADGPQQKAAWCGADGPAQKAAWCGAEGSTKKAAWCGADGPATTKAAWCGADGPQKAAWCGADGPATAKQAAWCGADIKPTPPQAN
ncbi:MAG: hypothetical protein ABW190_09790 [Rhizobacter sp.]